MHYSLPKLLRIIGISLGVIVIIGYSLYQLRGFLLGPHITITHPAQGAVVNQRFIEIEGTAQNIVDIAFNGTPIFVDEEGAFTAPYVLAPGYNVVELQGTDRFGRQRTETLALIFR